MGTDESDDIEKGKLVELALNGLASPELSSLEEQEDTELLQPTNENRETVKSSVSGYKDKRLFSILQTNSSKNLNFAFFGILPLSNKLFVVPLHSEINISCRRFRACGSIPEPGMRMPTENYLQP